MSVHTNCIFTTVGPTIIYYLLQTVLEPKVVLLNHELVSRGYAELIDSTQEDGHTSATESS